MDILSLLSSVNIIALVAFFITLGFLIYEVMQLIKTGKTPDKPAIPQFQEGEKISISAIPQAVKKVEMGSQKNLMFILISVVLLIIFGSVGFLSVKSQKKTNMEIVKIPTSVPIVTPTPAIFETPTPEVIPTEVPVLTPVLTDIPILTASSTAAPTSQTSLSPTIISELPETGHLTNSIILFSVSAVVIFFSFIF